MTGRELQALLNNLSDETLDDFDISVKVGNEYFTLLDVVTNDPHAEDILDDGSPVLISGVSAVIKNENGTSY